MVKEKINYFKIFQIFIWIMVILLFVNILLKDNSKEFILENVHLAYFNQTNMTHVAYWFEGDVLYTISKNRDNILKISEGEECTKKIMTGDKCLKFWSGLYEGDVIIVAIAKADKCGDGICEIEINESINTCPIDCEKIKGGKING